MDNELVIYIQGNLDEPLMVGEEDGICTKKNLICDSIEEKISNLYKEVYGAISNLLSGIWSVSQSLNDHKPEYSPVNHEFELYDEETFHCKSRRLNPRHNQKFRGMLEKKLSPDIIMPTSSVWELPDEIAPKRMVIPNVSLIYDGCTER